MKRFWRGTAVIGFVGAAAIVTYVCTARAGLSLYSPVIINVLGATASGALGSARNEPDPTEYINCTLIGTTTGLTASCQARDAFLGVATCSSTNANIIGALQKVPQDAFVSFSWDAFLNCTSVLVRTGSRQEPKVF
jgi:hypothetical protein